MHDPKVFSIGPPNPIYVYSRISIFLANKDSPSKNTFSIYRFVMSKMIGIKPPAIISPQLR